MKFLFVRFYETPCTVWNSRKNLCFHRELLNHGKVGLEASKSNTNFIMWVRHINFIKHCLIKAIHSNLTVHVIVKTKLVTHQFSIKNKHATTYMPSSYPYHWPCYIAGVRGGSVLSLNVHKSRWQPCLIELVLESRG